MMKRAACAETEGHCFSRWAMLRTFSARNILIALLLSARLAPAADWVDWQWVNPRPQGRTLYEIEELSGGQTLAVGIDGTIMVHGDDGWQMTMTGAPFDLLEVTTNGDIIVAIGGKFRNHAPWEPNHGVILTSYDGVTWTEERYGIGTAPRAVIHDGEKFVAIGNRFLLTSSDGIHWEQHALPEELEFYGAHDLAWNGSRFVAAADHGHGQFGDGGPRAILVSDDGLHWEEVPLPDEIPLFSTIGVAWGDGRFVVAGAGEVMTSNDGLAWSMSPDPLPRWITCLAYEGGIFIAAGGYAFESTSWVAQSADGRSWTVFDLTIDEPMYDIEWIGDHYEGVGYDGVMATSVDGIHWTETSTNTVDFFGWLIDFAKSGDGSTLVVTGEKSIVATSEDGFHWSSQQVHFSDDAEGYFSTVRWVNGEFWAVGSSLWRSEDGTSWEPRHEEDPDREYYDIAGNDEILVVVGRWSEIPQIMTSSDGKTWSRYGSPIAGTWITKIAWWDGKFIALSDGGRYILTSTDGIDWQASEMHGYVAFESFAWSPSEMVIVASTSRLTGDVLLTTEDGISFEAAASPLEWLRDITWTGDQFVGVGWDGVITSRDGHQWRAQDLGLGWTPRCVEGRGTELYVAGINGSILRARNVATAPRKPSRRVP